MSEVILGRGYLLDRVRRGRAKKIIIPAKDRMRHMWVFGTTGVGKTKLIEGILEQDIPAGNSVVFIDPKGDTSIFAKIIQVARSCGREKDLMLFTPVYPELSVHFNPLRHFKIVEEQSSHIVAGIQDGKEPYFKNIAKDISSSLVLMWHFMTFGRVANSKDLVLTTDNNAFSLVKVLEQMNYNNLTSIRKNINANYDSADALRLIANLDRLIQVDAEYYNKVSSSLYTVLSQMCSGNVGRIVGNTQANPLIDELEKGNCPIFVAQLGALLTRETAYVIAKVILSSLQAFAGRVYSINKVLKKPLTIHIDEAQSTLYQGIDELFAKAGSANVYLHGYCQSISQMNAIIGEQYTKAILDNCNTKLFMKAADIETANYLSSYFGMKKELSGIISADAHMTWRDTEVAKIKPTEITNLKRQQFYLTTYSGGYKGITNMVQDTVVDICYPSGVGND